MTGNMQAHYVRLLFERSRLAAVAHGFTDNDDGFLKYVEYINRENKADYLIWLHAISAMRDSQTIIVSTEQVRVFDDLRKSTVDALDYRLPYPATFLQFSSLYDVVEDEMPLQVSGLILTQKEITKSEYIERTAAYSATDKSIIPMSFDENSEAILLNNLFVLAWHDDSLIVAKSAWQSDTMHHEMHGDPGIERYKDLAIACIGYINCENVYLHKEGEVPDRVNRKREAKGKSRLEPYYVCRIRGVNYDSAATSTGAAHSIRYDVRGHFRRLATGKTTWVKAHQRGLANELYVPKTYKADKGSKPGWKGNTP